MGLNNRGVYKNLKWNELLLMMEVTTTVNPLILSFVLKSLLKFVLTLIWNKRFCLECLYLLSLRHCLLLRVNLIIWVLDIGIPIGQIWMTPEVLVEATVLVIHLPIEVVQFLLLLIRLISIIILVRFSNCVSCIFNDMDSPLLVLKELFGVLG